MDKVLNFLSLSPGASYTITGTYSYYLEVSIKGDSPYQTSTISLTAFTKSDKKIAIAISCKWYRVLSDRQYRLATIHSNAYQLSAEDLGSILKIEITPQEEDQSGTATVQYGPIRLDPNVRSTLENILGAGGSRFPAQVVDEETGVMSREPAALSMTSEYIRVVETPPVGKEKEVKFKYNYDNPKVELNYLDCTRLYFLFNGEEEDCEAVKKFLGIKKGTGCKLGVKFLSRTARDLLILSIKCFATKNYLVSSMLINEVAFCPGKIFKDRKDAPQQIGDTLLEVDSIKREMYLVLLRNQELNKDKERLQISVKRLEEELSSTIETYSQLINEVRTSSDMSQTTESAGEYRKRAETLEEEVKKLRRRVQELEDDKMLEDKGTGHGGRRKGMNRENEEIADIRNDFEALAGKKEEPNLFSLEYEMKLHDLEEENERLKSEVKSLRGRNSVQPDMMRGMKGRGTVADESFSVVENRLVETKRLNEQLLKQVNELKTKNSSVNKEIDMLRAQVASLREGNDNEQQIKEKLHRQDKEALEKELQRLKEDNIKLLREKSYGQPGNFSGERERYEAQSAELARRIEGLQREVMQLKERNSQLERQANMGVDSARGYNSVNMSQSASAFNTPSKRMGEGLESGRNRAMDEEFALKVRAEMDALGRDAMGWKSKCTNLEIDLDKLRRENNEMRVKVAQIDAQNSSGVMGSGNNDFMSYIDKSVMNTSRTYEALLADSKRENDRLYGEVALLKAKLTTMEFSLQNAKGELERARSPLSVQFGLENELTKVRKEADTVKEENERLRGELNSVRMTAGNMQMAPEEKDRLLRERDQMRGQLELMQRERGNHFETVERLKDAERKLNEKSREVEMLRAELENYKTKNGALLKEVDYFRSEIGNLKRKDESMLLNMSAMMGGDNEYKMKYEMLEEEYRNLEKEFNKLRATGFQKKKEDAEGLDSLQQTNELLRKEVVEYKRRISELEQSRMSVRDTNVVSPNDEELRKRNKALETEMQNQRGRIADLEKENERFKIQVMGSLRESTNDESFVRAKGNNLKFEVERLKNENESLLLQRTQLSKKVESLGKELESKVGAKTNQAMLENLARTNEKLIQENARLMEELESARYGSRLDNSRMESSRYEDNDRVRELQNELHAMTAERDHLMVEVSKIKAMEKNKRMFI